MRIAITGIRGVPARYSGLEACAEEVGTRLVKRGHEVIVYCRKGNYDDSLKEYKGIKLITLPSLKFKVTDTFSHTFLSMCHVLTQKVDVILAFNPAISTLCLIPKIKGYKVALHMDGFDWERKKWGWFARKFIKTSARLAARICDMIVTDSIAVKKHCEDAFACNPVYIAYGAYPDTSEKPEIIREYGLEKDGYFLFLSRIEPENTVDVIVEAFEQLDTDKKLVIGGGAGYRSRFLEKLKRTKDERIIFPGPVYEPLHVKELHCNCYAVIHGNQAGGASTGLLKALGLGTCVLTVHTTDNAHVVSDAAVLYDLSPEALRKKMRYLLDHPEKVEEYRRKAVERVRTEYVWEQIADQYEQFFISLVGNQSDG